ncbi:hypothetical protein M5D96_011860, partial [Drosophila gunungcola]
TTGVEIAAGSQFQLLSVESNVSGIPPFLALIGPCNGTSLEVRRLKNTSVCVYEPSKS